MKLLVMSLMNTFTEDFNLISVVSCKNNLFSLEITKRFMLAYLDINFVIGFYSK